MKISWKKLILKAPITTAADDKFCKIFPNFRKNNVWYCMRIVCQQTNDSHEISCLICYFWKSGQIWNCRLLQIIGDALRVKGARTSSQILPPLFQDTWPYVQLLCAERHSSKVQRKFENVDGWTAESLVYFKLNCEPLAQVYPSACNWMKRVKTKGKIWMFTRIATHVYVDNWKNCFETNCLIYVNDYEEILTTCITIAKKESDRFNFCAQEARLVFP